MTLFVIGALKMIKLKEFEFKYKLTLVLVSYRAIGGVPAMWVNT